MDHPSLTEALEQRDTVLRAFVGADGRLDRRDGAYCRAGGTVELD